MPKDFNCMTNSLSDKNNEKISIFGTGFAGTRNQLIVYTSVQFSKQTSLKKAVSSEYIENRVTK